MRTIAVLDCTLIQSFIQCIALCISSTINLNMNDGSADDGIIINGRVEVLRQQEQVGTRANKHFMNRVNTSIIDVQRIFHDNNVLYLYCLVNN